MVWLNCCKKFNLSVNCAPDLLQFHFNFNPTIFAKQIFVNPNSNAYLTILRGFDNLDKWHWFIQLLEVVNLWYRFESLVSLLTHYYNGCELWIVNVEIGEWNFRKIESNQNNNNNKSQKHKTQNNLIIVKWIKIFAIRIIKCMLFSFVG